MVLKNTLYIGICLLTLTISVTSGDTQPQEGSKPAATASPRPEFLDSVENVFHFLGKWVVGTAVKVTLGAAGYVYGKISDSLTGEENTERRENIYKWTAIGLTTGAAIRGVYSWWQGVPFWGQPGKSWWKKKFPQGVQQTMILNN